VTLSREPLFGIALGVLLGFILGSIVALRVGDEGTDAARRLLHRLGGEEQRPRFEVLLQ